MSAEIMPSILNTIACFTLYIGIPYCVVKELKG